MSTFQSSVRINVGPNCGLVLSFSVPRAFQSSVRINVGPNSRSYHNYFIDGLFQSSVRINVGPNCAIPPVHLVGISVSILRED